MTAAFLSPGGATAAQYRQRGSCQSGVTSTRNLDWKSVASTPRERRPPISSGVWVLPPGTLPYCQGRKEACLSGTAADTPLQKVQKVQKWSGPGRSPATRRGPRPSNSSPASANEITQHSSPSDSAGWAAVFYAYLCSHPNYGLKSCFSVPYTICWLVPFWL